MAASIYSVTRGCTICGTCVLECTAEAISLSEKGAAIDPAKCRGCGKCYDNCASEAIEKMPAAKTETQEAPAAPVAKG